MEQKIAGILGTEEFVEAVKINERLAGIDKTIEEVNGYYKRCYGGRLVF